jgi:hypothetical protein
MISLLVRIFTVIPLLIDLVKLIIGGIQSIVKYVQKKQHDKAVGDAIKKAKETHGTTDLEKIL